MGAIRRRLRIATIVGLMALRAGRWRAVVVLLLNVFLSLTLPASALFMKLLADAALARNVRGSVVAALGLAAQGGVHLVARWGAFTMRSTIDERARYLFEEEIMSLVASVPVLEPHERPEFVDQLDVLRTNAGWLTGAIWSLYENISFAASVGATALLLAQIHPALLVLPLFGVPSIFTGGRAERMRQRLLDAQAEKQRTIRHLFDLATTAGPGKELRIFRMRDELLARHSRLWTETNREMLGALLWGAVLRTIGWVVFSVGYIGSVVFATRLAAVGRATPGDILLTLTLSGRVQTDVASAVSLTKDLLARLATAGRYLWLIDYAEEARRRVRDPLPTPAGITDGLSVEGMSFRYPGTDTDVLSDVSLRIPAGSTVALVGENGAGKTTLAKLLCGFYTPTSGRIALDGTDLGRFDPAEWASRLSAGFQDFARLEFLARETVGVGDVARISEAPAVELALSRASASDVIPGLPDGLESQLGKSFEHGVDLSTGQWQKLALGRAMMRNTPLLLVLDEPTASLDAMTEHALFERYTDAARRSSNLNGAITVLVSHRFSTVRMADLIVVIDGGRVLEQGSHDELMRKAGLYAELYELQARAYR